MLGRTEFHLSKFEMALKTFFWLIRTMSYEIYGNWNLFFLEILGLPHLSFFLKQISFFLKKKEKEKGKGDTVKVLFQTWVGIYIYPFGRFWFSLITINHPTAFRNERHSPLYYSNKVSVFS